MRARHDRRLVQKRLVGLLGVSLILAACSSSAASSAPAASVAAPSQAASAAAAVGRSERAREDPGDRVPLLRGRQQLRRPDARRGKDRCRGRQREHHRLRREPGPCRPGEAAPGRHSVGQVRRDHHPAAVRRRDGRGRQEGDRRRDRGRQHRPGPRFRHDHRELAGRGPELQRRLRPERARTQDRRARRRRPVPTSRPTRATSATSGRSRRPPSTYALKAAFDTAIASHPEIKVVSDSGESFYTTALGLKASQDIVAAHPDVSVIVSADQAITGAVQAVKDIAAKVRLVGYGGGAIAFQDIAAGTRFGTVMQAPATEGRPRHRAAHPGDPDQDHHARHRPAGGPARWRRRDEGQRPDLPRARGVAGLSPVTVG